MHIINYFKSFFYSYKPMENFLPAVYVSLISILFPKTWDQCYCSEEKKYQLSFASRQFVHVFLLTLSFPFSF